MIYIYISNNLLLIDNKKINISDIKDILVNLHSVKFLLLKNKEITLERMNNSEFEDEMISDIVSKIKSNSNIIK